MIPRAICLALAGLAAMSSLAIAAEPFWLSEPGLCKADHGVIEEKDAIYLTGTGINSHFFSCQWPASAGEGLFKGEQFIRIKAKCSNATSSWQAAFEIVRQQDGSLQVFQESGGLSPVRFFRCN